MSEIKSRMAALGISQVDMILELKERGISVSASMMSSILRGVYTYEKSKVVLSECDNILTEKEHGVT